MSVVNRTALRHLTLGLAARLRPAVGFTRVSTEFIQRMESWLRLKVSQEIMALPSKGKTIR